MNDSQYRILPHSSPSQMHPENQMQDHSMQQGQMRGMGQGPMGAGQELSYNNTQLANDIARAIILEVQAYNYYQKLMELTENENYRFIISRIQRDEIKHYRWFTMLLNMLGVDIPQIPMGRLPSNFTEGVKEAIQNEIDAQEFYQDIAYRANNRPIQMHFMHAASDEQRHASMLSTILFQ